MKLNYFTKWLSIAKRWVATTVLCLSALAFIWQGAFFSNATAVASPSTNLIAAADFGDRVQEKTSNDAGRAKNFIRDTADKVKGTAQKNANKVDRATDNNDSLLQRKAKKDKATIERRADEDAARTEKAVDKTKNAVERTVDNIKGVFGN